MGACHCADDNDYKSFRHRKSNRYGVRYDLLKTYVQITQYIFYSSLCLSIFAEVELAEQFENMKNIGHREGRSGEMLHDKNNNYLCFFTVKQSGKQKTFI